MKMAKIKRTYFRVINCVSLDQIFSKSGIYDIFIGRLSLNRQNSPIKSESKMTITSNIAGDGSFKIKKKYKVQFRLNLSIKTSYVHD